MSRQNRHSTADIPMRFPSHGLVETNIDGNVVRHVAIGPFNDELLVAYATVQEPIIAEMARLGRWIDFYVIEQSALATQQTIVDYALYLKDLADRRLAPYSTIFVIAPDVEGAAVMKPLYLKCFADAGLRFRMFEHKADAEAWLQQEASDC